MGQSTLGTRQGTPETKGAKSPRKAHFWAHGRAGPPGSAPQGPRSPGVGQVPPAAGCPPTRWHSRAGREPPAGQTRVVRGDAIRPRAGREPGVTPLPPLSKKTVQGCWNARFFPPKNVFFPELTRFFFWLKNGHFLANFPHGCVILLDV